ncbi:hypothetical protein AZE42_11473 [Rhizopogon vesiculosus]|uniref:Fungal STAND N-terminal Goodbye domain-containing protein n=1 Tax=Rhizopogon vesiculosus TaxID=180088 RepID=A0A1J8QU33_9AGAM|nr:hypothetical protein AZE42_11473 [Rhizopogon vesiculosus]
MNRQEQDVTIEQAQKTLHDTASNLNSTSAKSLNQADLFVQTVQTVESENDLLNRNAAVFQSASDAIADLSRGDILKKTPGDFLAVATKVMDALDVVKQVHPFVGVAVIAFMAVVNLELKRRENDHRVSSMIAQATDMMGMLLQLKDVKDPDITGPYGETIEGRLQDVMKHIAQDIEDCGNAIDKYCKSKFIVKFFRSDTWANEFLNICKSFSERKDELKLALNIRTALRVDIAIDKLEQLIQMKSERESRFSAAVKLRGGREKCIESPDLLVELVDTSEQWEARPQNRSHIEPPSKNDNRLASKTVSANEQNRLVSVLLRELNTPLHSLLDENRAYFKLAVSIQTSRITDTINASEERIIRTINTNNIFQQVDDPHLRYIWKQMKWRTNVKTQYFIAELHDYYMNRFSHIYCDGRRAGGTLDVSSLMVPVRYPDCISDSAAEGEDHRPAINRADEWCLKYLTVLYVPSLSEGFDGDANSLVSIREVNGFTSAKPSDWSLLQALAYWAAGWRVDSNYYQTRIEEALESMIIAQSNALPENRVCITSYLDSYTITGVKRLIRSIAQLDSEYYDSDLMQLASWRRKAQEEELADKLNAVKYEIDSMDSIKLFGSGRIENFLLPLLYLVIRRHLQIMKLASTVILVVKELQFAAQSIDNILGGVDLRVRQLAGAFSRHGIMMKYPPKLHSWMTIFSLAITVMFRQQGTDPQMRFAWYAHGLYKIWYSPDPNPDDTKYWATNFFNIIDDAELDNIDISALKLGPFSLEGASEQLERPDQPVTSSSGRDPESIKEEYIHLWCLNDFHDNRYHYFDDAPPCISPEEKQRLDIMSRELRREDIQCWSSLAHLCSRKRDLM